MHAATGSFCAATHGDEFRSIYALAQLQLARDKAGSALRLELSHYSMEQERALVNLEHNDRLNMAWSMTSHEHEQRRELWFTAPPVR